MKNIKLSTRIYFQQILLVLALIGLGVYSLNNLQMIAGNAVELDEDDFPVLALNIALTEKLNAEAQEFLKCLGAAKDVIIASEADKKESKIYYEATCNSFLESEKETEAAFAALEDKIALLLNSETETAMITMLKGLSTLVKEIKNNNVKIFGMYEEIKHDVDANDMSAIIQAGKILNEMEDVQKLKLEELLKFSESDIERSVGVLKETLDGLVSVLLAIVICVSIVAIILTVITGLSLRTLRTSVFAISGSVQQVATAAAQSSNAISMVSDGAKTQTESINQAVTAVEQSVSVLSEVSSSSEKATEIAKISGLAVVSGKEKMLNMVQVVGRIQDNSNKVNKITEIISGIASQTNMLALNAAIEAARAGEQGKGFAVVADQVKSLAESSKNSVDEIVDLIEQAKLDAAEAVKVAQMVSGEMEKIEDGVRKTEQMMQSISTAMEEQVSTTEELSHNMDTLRDIGTSNANAAEEITETIMELSRISNETNDELKKFNI